MIFERIQKKIKSGDNIPKPRSRKAKVIEIKPNKNNELSLYYTIGSKVNFKYVTKSDFEKAFDILNKRNELTRNWFDNNLDKKNSNPCNYTIIGSIFEMLGEAKFACTGLYVKI